MKAYDTIIIGTGQAGPSLAHRLAGAGMNVAIIERKLFGGTCVNTGCIPTKAMVASAYAARIAQRACEYGVMLDGFPKIDMKAVKARKDAISAKSRRTVRFTAAMLALRARRRCAYRVSRSALTGYSSTLAAGPQLQPCQE
jgi:pyruvate/2-oxoglutarate dehydrogenase complex dihydrolipoamide dehydrogenase (E3) component